jgi:pimeloyl-ACP methyl ester carboxylesterase
MSATLLLHGASGNAASWAPVLAHLGPHVRALDLPGRGSTGGPPCDSVQALARWLAESLDAPATLVGHSLGGAVALQTALDWPDRVARLVLVSSAARLKVHPMILEAVRQSTAEAPHRLDAAFGPGTSRGVVDAYAAATASVPPATALTDWLACDAFDVRDRLSEVQVPTVVVYGSEDFLTVPKHQVRLAEALNAERVELDGIGHMLPWEAPDRLAGLLTV